MRVLLVAIVPPLNDCGVRVVMYRHMVERQPFEVRLCTKCDFPPGAIPELRLRLPYLLHRLRKTRFGPRLARWITDFENLLWPLMASRSLEDTIANFRPDVILTLAENGLSHIARKAAKRHGIPLAGLFLDWFPVMQDHYGHAWTRGWLDRRFRELHAACDLVFCTSRGMQQKLGPHPNSHVIFPMPGRHKIPEKTTPPHRGRFRLVYVGSVQSFYGRMLCSLLRSFRPNTDLELLVVGPKADWPEEMLAASKESYLGFKPPEEAATVLAGADALLVAMSFEEEHELFMRTSFTTKFLDYVAYGKPVILWGPSYCEPARVARAHGGALVVEQPEPEAVVAACRQIAAEPELQRKLAAEAAHLHQNLFNPENIQEVFVREMERLARKA